MKPHVLNNPEPFDESVAKYNLLPCDLQRHVFSAATPYTISVYIHNTDNLTPDRLRAEILTSAYVAVEVYKNLPEEVRRFDKSVIDQAFEAQRRNAISLGIEEN